MDILDNEIEQLFDSIFSNEQKNKIEHYENFNKSYSAELFSLIAESNPVDTSFEFIETSISISANDYLLSQKNILKIINE